MLEITMTNNLNTIPIIALLVASLLNAKLLQADLLIDFDDLSAFTNTEPDGSYFEGYGAGASPGSWSTEGVSFNTNTFGPGWSYSNVNDTTTGDFTNQWAAYPGTDVSGSGNYAL